jgi:hypothetical protein
MLDLESTLPKDTRALGIGDEDGAIVAAFVGEVAQAVAEGDRERLRGLVAGLHEADRARCWRRWTPRTGRA